MFQKIVHALLFLSIATLAESFASINVGIPISANKVATFLLLVVVGFRLLSRQIGPAPSAKNLWLIAFGLGVLPSLATAFLLGESIGQVINSGLTVAMLIVFYFLLTIVIRTPEDVKVAVWAVAVGTAVTAVTTVAGVGQQDTYYGRGGGLSGNPNLSALYAVTGIGFSSYLLLTERKIWRKVLMTVFIGLGLLAIVQTVSRAGFVSLLAMGGFILIRYRRLDLLQFAIPAGVLAAVAFLAFAPETYYDRISSLSDEANDLAVFSLENDRIRSWYYGMLAFFNYPLSGCGIKSFHNWLAVAHPDQLKTPVPHSSYIRLLATTGLAGAIPWAAAAIVTWFEFSRVRAMTIKRRADEGLRTLFNQATFFQAVYFAWLVASLVSPFEFDKGIWLSFGLATALLAVTRQRIAAVEGAPDGAAQPVRRAPIESPYSPASFQPR